MALSATWSLNTTGFLELQWELTGADLAILRAAASEQTFPPGAEIVTSGDTDEAMYLILEGWVRIVRIRGHHPPQGLARLGPFCSFGEMAFLTSCPRTASAVAETTVRALGLTRDRIKRLWTEDPQLVLSFYQTLTQALTHSLSHGGRFPTHTPHT